MSSSDNTNSSVSSYAESHLPTPMRVNISKAVTNKTPQKSDSFTSKTAAQSSTNTAKTTKLGSALQMLARFDKKYRVKPAEPSESVNNPTLSSENVIVSDSDSILSAKTPAKPVSSLNTNIQLSKKQVFDANDNSVPKSVHLMLPEENYNTANTTKASLSSKSWSVPSTKDLTEVKYDSDFEPSDSAESTIKTLDSKADSNSESHSDSLHKLIPVKVHSLALSETRSRSTEITRGPDKEEPIRLGGNGVGIVTQIKNISPLVSPQTKSTMNLLENVGSELNNDTGSDTEEILSEEEPFEEKILTFKDLLLNRSKNISHAPEQQSRAPSSDNLKVIHSEDKLEQPKQTISTASRPSAVDFLYKSSGRMSPTLIGNTSEPNFIATEHQVSEPISSLDDGSLESEIEEEIEVPEDKSMRRSSSSSGGSSKRSIGQRKVERSLESEQSSETTDLKFDPNNNDTGYEKQFKSIPKDSVTPKTEDAEGYSIRIREKPKSVVLEDKTGTGTQKAINLDYDFVSTKEKQKSERKDSANASNVVGVDLGDIYDLIGINEKRKSIHKDSVCQIGQEHLEGGDKESHRSAGSRRKRRERRKSILTETERDECEWRKNMVQQPHFSPLKLPWNMQEVDGEYMTLNDSNEIFQTSPEVQEALASQKPMAAALGRLLLRQLRLTRHFMASQYEMYVKCSETVASISRGYQPTTLEDTKQFITAHRQSRSRTRVKHQY